MHRGRGTTIAAVSLTQSPPRGSRAPDDPAEGAEAEREVRPEIVAVALVATALGVVLRFVADTPLWLDEALSANIASLPISDIPEALKHDGHPPLYYVLLHGWMEAFGDSDVAVRSLSGVLSVLTLPLAWLAGRRRGGPVLAWVMLALVAVAPFATRYATETRMYALVMFLVLAGYLLLDDVVRRGVDGWLRLVAVTVVTALLLYTHYWGLWLLMAVGIVLLWRSFRAGSPTTRSNARHAAVAMVVGGLLFVPWLPTMLYQAQHTGTPWAGAQRPFSMLAVTLGDFGGGGFRDAEFVGTLLALLFVLGFFGRSLSRSQILLNLRTERQFRYEAVVTVLTLAIGGSVAFVTSSAFASRYASVFFPLFLLVVAGGVTRFSHRLIRVGVLVVMLVASLGGVYFGATDQRSQAREAASSIEAQARPGDLVIYCPDQLGPAGARELDADVTEVVFPSFGAPQLVDWVDYEERSAASDPAAFATEAVDRAGPDAAIFVVWNGEYRTFEGKCELLVDSLSILRPGSQTIVSSGAGDFYEFASVAYFPAAA